jgi:hypothetical protein
MSLYKQLKCETSSVVEFKINVLLQIGYFSFEVISFAFLNIKLLTEYEKKLLLIFFDFGMIILPSTKSEVFRK